MLYGYGVAILNGTITTLQVTFGALLVALLMGLITAYAKNSGSIISRSIATSYTVMTRSAPDFVWLLFLYFGGQTLLNHITNSLGLEIIQIHALTASILILGLVYGGYLCETFRGALLAIPTGQIEAAQSFGLSNWTIFIKIQFPQMMKHAIPGIGNNWLVLVKASAIASMVSLNELIFNANAAGRATNNILFFLLVATAIYLCITSVSILFLGYLNRKYAKGSKEIVL